MKKAYILAGLFSVMLCAGAMLLSKVGQGGAVSQREQATPVKIKQISAISYGAAWAIGEYGAAYRWNDGRKKWEKMPSPKF